MTTLTYESDVTASATIDGVRFGVTYAGMRFTPNDGTRAAYHWQVDLPGNVQGGTDLNGPATGGNPGPRAMLASLCTFLGAAAESYSHQMRHPGSTPENLTLFPIEVVEWAYRHDDDITMLGIELDEEAGA